MSVNPRFDDQSRWEVIPDVNVFDEHEAIDPATGARYPIDKARLETIAGVMNARDKKQPCPLTRGHTVPHQYDDNGKLIRPSGEHEQPITFGYGREYKVAYDDTLERHVIRGSLWLDKQHSEEAKTYPRISVEFWPQQNEFAPIALLRRTPKRDLGQWIYSRRGPCLRYSLEAAELPETPDPMDAPDAAAPDMAMRNTVMQCVQECFGSMLAAALPEAMKAHMAAQNALAGPTNGAVPEAADPALEEEIAGKEEEIVGKEEEIQGEEKEIVGEEEEEDEEKPLPFARDEDMSQEQVARHEREMATERKARKAAEDRIAAIERDGRVARYERDLHHLVDAEGYEFDPAKELESTFGGKKVADFNQEEFDAHKAHIVRHYARAPIGGQMIRAVLPADPAAKNKPMTEAELPLVLQYMREGKAKSDKEALKMVREAQ